MLRVQDFFTGRHFASELGKDARRLAKALTGVQSTLGEHQDSVVVQPVLRQLGVRAHLDADNAFTFGRLHAHEQHRAALSDAQFSDAWAQASDKKLRRWLR